MKSQKKILAIMLTFAMLLPMIMGIPVTAATQPKQIDILFTHDTHSHSDSFPTIVDGKQKEVGGYARI